MKTPPNLGSVLDRVARAAIGKDWALYGAMLSHWPEIVGESYAKTTTPVKVVFPHGKKTDEKWAQQREGNGTLTIRAPKGLAMELTFAFETIRARINGFFGYPAIGKIVLETTFAVPPAPKPPARALAANEKESLQSATQSVENDEIRQALAELGASVLLSTSKE